MLMKRWRDHLEGDDEENQNACAPLIVQIDQEEKENN
jgi:hypothetical protein